MKKIQIDLLHDKLWRVLELLQRVNILGDVDQQQFQENNARCMHIKEVIHGLYECNKRSLYEARGLVAEYLGIFSDDELEDE